MCLVGACEEGCTQIEHRRHKNYTRQTRQSSNRERTDRNDTRSSCEPVSVYVSVAVKFGKSARASVCWRIIVNLILFAMFSTLTVHRRSSDKPTKPIVNAGWLRPGVPKITASQFPMFAATFNYLLKFEIDCAGAAASVAYHQNGSLYGKHTHICV